VGKNPQKNDERISSSKMTYNIIDDLTKLHISLLFLEVVKIPQQKENLLKVLENGDKPNTRVEAVIIGNQ
jgi:hypothetical protein